MEENKALFGRFDALRDLLKKENIATMLMAFNLVSDSNLKSYAEVDGAMLESYYNGAREGKYNELEEMCETMETTLRIHNKVRAQYYNSDSFKNIFRRYQV